MQQGLAWDLNPTLGRCQAALVLDSSRNSLSRPVCPSFFQKCSWTFPGHCKSP